MALTYVNIASTTVGTATNAVTFSSIPSTYTDLAVRWSARCDNEQNRIRLTFNGSSATTYSETGMNGDGTAPSYTRTSNATYISLWFGMNNSAYTANTFSNGELYIPSYTVSQNKPSWTFMTQETSATQSLLQMGANLWRNTSAISSMTFTTNANNFVVGSTFYLYGIKNS